MRSVQTEGSVQAHRPITSPTCLAPGGTAVGRVSIELSLPHPLPYTLRSTGITRLRRYYGSSDSADEQVAAEVAVVLRVSCRPHREPQARSVSGYGRTSCHLVPRTTKPVLVRSPLLHVNGPSLPFASPTTICPPGKGVWGVPSTGQIPSGLRHSVAGSPRQPAAGPSRRTLPGRRFGWRALPAATSPAPPSRLTAAFHRVCFERRSASRCHVGRGEELQRSIVASPSHRPQCVGTDVGNNSSLF